MNETTPNKSCCASNTDPALRTPCGCESYSATTEGNTCLPTAPWVIGTVSTSIGPVLRIGTSLCLIDTWGACQMRLGIGRMRYRIPAGLYAVGNPTPDSPVLVSANYKLTFDRLRSELTDLSTWILILDTQGVNVWCAAGKGTFGTDEIIRRIECTKLPDLVNHHTLIVPQLGAPGVAAHEVRKRSGFRVVYGPVRAHDIPAFLEAKMKATPEMRQVQFNLPDRIAVIPIELFHWAKYAFIIAICFFFLAGLSREGYGWINAAHHGALSAGLFLTAYFCSCVFAPILLPWLPGRAFATKGLFLGVILLLLLGFTAIHLSEHAENWFGMAAWSLLIPTVASFITMNYTGTSTYTSLSGVRREMRIAVPIQMAGAIVGSILWIVARFV
jgi:hypothetical protein